MNLETRQRIEYNIIIPILAVLSGLLLASVFILIAGHNPLTAYAEMFQAAFSCEMFTRCALFTTLQLATPLILTGLSAVVAFRSGMFSLGQEGQLYLGGMAAAWVGYAIHLPPIIHPAVAILAAMLVGGIYGWLPGMLKVRIGVNEIISTIVLNNVAILFVTYLINFPLRADASTTAHSPVIDDSARLMSFAPGSDWGVGFILALIAAGLVYLYLWRSTPGYEQRMAGQSRRFAMFGGIPSSGAAIRGMFISGALAGLAGSIEALGVHGRMLQGFSSGLGFDGLTAAILGQVHPLGALAVAILFAGLRNGAQLGLQFSMRIPRELGGGIIALMILFVAAPQLYRPLIDRIDKLLQALSRGKQVEEQV
jgi:general nucleoside transport system permease protein